MPLPRSRRPGVSALSAAAGWLALSALSLLVSSHLQAQGAPPVREWRVAEQWRVDGAEQGAAGFADLRDFVVTADNTLWTLDFKEQTIRRYDARGRFLGTSGRSGAGPGEMRNANGLLVHGDGTVWLNDPSNGRLTVFGADGRYVRQHVLPSFGFGFRWDAWFDRRTREVIDPSLAKIGEEYGRVWRRVGADGADRGVLAAPACAGLIQAGGSRAFTGWRAEGPGGAMGAYPFTQGGGTAPTGRGGVWCAEPEATQAVLVRLGGNDTMARTALRLPRIPVDRAERTREIDAIRTRLQRYATNDFDASKVPSSKPPIAALSVDDDGRLWVRHSAPAAVTRTTFDVHDESGAHLGRVIVPDRVSMALPPRARGPLLWVGVVDEDGVLSIVHFTMAEPARR